VLGNEYMARTAWKHGVMGALSVVAQVLALRLLVLIAIVGQIWLTYLALGDPNPFRLIALGIYGASVVIPTIYLALRKQA
jgi:hypothetical protein